MAVCLVRVLSGPLRLQRAQVHGGSVLSSSPLCLQERLCPSQYSGESPPMSLPQPRPQSWLLTALGCAHVLQSRSQASTIYTCQGDMYMGKMTAGCLP